MARFAALTNYRAWSGLSSSEGMPGDFRFGMEELKRFFPLTPVAWGFRVDFAEGSTAARKVKRLFCPQNSTRFGAESS